MSEARMRQGAGIWLYTFAWRDDVAGWLRGREGLRLFRSLDGTVGRASVPAVADALHGGVDPLPLGVTRTLVDLVLDVPGASAGQDAPFHYVVSTDVLPEFEAEMNDWYDTEHMPGLAAVPGTVRARRHVARQGSPRYHASYDLALREAFNSPPWLAVRATPWSSRVRPAFRNTARMMYQRVE